MYFLFLIALRCKKVVDVVSPIDFQPEFVLMNTRYFFAPGTLFHEIETPLLVLLALLILGVLMKVVVLPTASKELVKVFLSAERHLTV